MLKYFGTDGFRGKANKDIRVDHAYKIGRFLGWYYTKNKRARIVIGKDTRRSSYMFEYALIAGLTASGADVFMLHVTTTPCVSYITRTEDFDCGIMISASHNPFYDNGIKIIDENGYKLNQDIEEEIEAYIDGRITEKPLATGKNIGVVSDYSIGRNRYIGHLISSVKCSFINMRVGLDCSNGGATSIAKNVFDMLGVKTYVIGNEPNGININMECGSTHIGKLRELVKEHNLDVAFAYDGDADRCIAVDENGNEINGDYIIYICAKYLKQSKKLNNNTIVATIMSNLGLFKALDQLGIDYVKTTVGDKYVNDEMVKNDYSLGGEQTGHIIFGKYATTGDGILTSLMIMQAINESKQSLGSLASEMKMYPQIFKNVGVENKSLVKKNLNIQKKEYEINKLLGNDGRIIIRESGTEPVIRIMVEAKSNEICNQYIEELEQVLKMENLIN